MRLALVAALSLTAASVGAEPLDRADAFDRAFASSFYTFDSCGDGKHELIFRQVLAARFAQCPFTPEAREAHRLRGLAQAKLSRARLQRLIDENGGLPIRLPGMTSTCRERQAEPEYVAAREKLDRFADGASKPEEVLPAPCDADVIAP